MENDRVEDHRVIPQCPAAGAEDDDRLRATVEIHSEVASVTLRDAERRRSYRWVARSTLSRVRIDPFEAAILPVSKVRRMSDRRSRDLFR